MHLLRKCKRKKVQNRFYRSDSELFSTFWQLFTMQNKKNQRKQFRIASIEAFLERDPYLGSEPSEPKDKGPVPNCFYRSDSEPFSTFWQLFTKKIKKNQKKNQQNRFYRSIFGTQVLSGCSLEVTLFSISLLN